MALDCMALKSYCCMKEELMQFEVNNSAEPTQLKNILRKNSSVARLKSPDFKDKNRLETSENVGTTPEISDKEKTKKF